MIKNKHLLEIALPIMIISGSVFTGAAYAQHFICVDPTGDSRPVVVQNATIDGVPIVSGDEIAVFDGPLCVGAVVFSGTFNATITVWMEFTPPGQPTLPGAKNGNPMSFKIWQLSSNTELALTPTYSVGTGTFGEPLTVVSLIAQAVPVELSSFTAVVIGNSVKLAWSTQTESNNYGFEIERSRDRISFSKIGFINGKGTMSIPQKYSFIDSDLPSGTYYYRLRQIDTDGSFSYSDIVEVEIKGMSVYFLYQNYPNPFNSETRIPFQIPVTIPVKLKIYNSLGQEIRILVKEAMVAGYHSLIWDGRDSKGEVVPSGMYYYKIQAGDFSKTRRLVLLK